VYEEKALDAKTYIACIYRTLHVKHTLQPWYTKNTWLLRSCKPLCGHALSRHRTVQTGCVLHHEICKSFHLQVDLVHQPSVQWHVSRGQWTGRLRAKAKAWSVVPHQSIPHPPGGWALQTATQAAILYKNTMCCKGYAVYVSGISQDAAGYKGSCKPISNKAGSTCSTNRHHEHSSPSAVFKQALLLLHSSLQDRFLIPQAENENSTVSPIRLVSTCRCLFKLAQSLASQHILLAIHGQERVPKRHIISVDTVHRVHPAGQQVMWLWRIHA